MKAALRFIAPSFVFWMVLFYLTGIIRFWFLDINPDGNWQEQAMQADVAIAMGFGILRGDDGVFRSGASNDSLFNWMAQNTKPKVIIAQEGILLAKNSWRCKEAAQKMKNIQLERMHEHGNRYVNTLKAARSALEKTDTIFTEKKLKIVIVCHPDQMKRCYYDLTRIAKTKSSRQDYSFIIPAIPSIPYDDKSAHLHTRNRFLFQTADILVSRPRDFVSLVIIRFAWIILPAGMILFVMYPVYRFLYRQRKKLIAVHDEDRILSLFLLSNTGLWFLLVGSAVILSWSRHSAFSFTVWMGLLIGLLAGLRSFVFWNSTSGYEKRPALGEPVGAMGMGCFLLAGNMLLGMISGLWL
jgi:hypothetical protein